MNIQASEQRRENQLLYCVLFAFFVSGAASQPLGSFIPFLRDTYGLSYDLSGVLLSCQSVSFLPKSLYFYRIRPGSITTSIPNASAFGSYGAYLRVLHSIRNPFLKLFFLVTKQAQATNIILGKFYRANVPMPYLYCSKYKILLYQILNCVISRPKDARILLRYYVDTYLRKAR